MKKKLSNKNRVASIVVLFVCILLLIVPMTSIVGTPSSDDCHCQNTNSQNNELLCGVLKRVGIFLENLGNKIPEGTIPYSLIVLMMLKIILLWNKYCDEYILPNNSMANV